jgi:HlyD family secretion protein
VNKKPLAWGVVVAVVAAAAGTFVYVRARGDTVPAVTTAVVTRGDVVEAVDATGTLEAVTTVQVGTQVSGTISELRADFNARVRKGQVIARLDPSLFAAQVEQARATVTRLEAEAARAGVQAADAWQKLRRAQELAARQLVAAADLEAAEATARAADAAVKASAAQIVQARASMHQADVNLGHTVITAPIDGIVISRNVDVGQTVAASMQAPTLFVIARDLTRMRVEARIAESDIGRVADGQPASFRVDAYPGRIYTGTVTQVRLQPVVEQNVVSYVTVIDVVNDDLTLRPGMTANVSVEIARAADVLRIPNSALRVRPSPEALAAFGVETGRARATAGREDGSRPGGERGAEVWLLTGDRLQPIAVQTGISDGTTTAVTAGDLAEGAMVVTGIAANGTAAARSPSPLLPAGRSGGRGGTTRPAGR